MALVRHLAKSEYCCIEGDAVITGIQINHLATVTVAMIVALHYSIKVIYADPGLAFRRNRIPNRWILLTPSKTNIRLDT
jgi:hypothetical protein